MLVCRSSSTPSAGAATIVEPPPDLLVPPRRPRRACGSARRTRRHHRRRGRRSEPAPIRAALQRNGGRGSARGRLPRGDRRGGERHDDANRSAVPALRRACRRRTTVPGASACSPAPLTGGATRSTSSGLRSSSSPALDRGRRRRLAVARTRCRNDRRTIRIRPPGDRASSRPSCLVKSTVNACRCCVDAERIQWRSRSS